MHARYAIARSPIGLMLVAATERGICLVGMGDSRDTLRKALADRFPKATLEESRATLAPLVADVLRCIDGPEKRPLPLDVRATPFQRRVWNALRRIPYGETRTYTQIARSIGAPKSSARAVGGACAKNPVSVVIPCHRAVRESGALAGFAWGLATKRRLLDRERARVQ